jgi:flagellin-like protein
VPSYGPLTTLLLMMMVVALAMVFAVLFVAYEATVLTARGVVYLAGRF